MGAGVPVEVAAIDDDAAHLCGVSVHILRGGVGDDVGAPLEGTAVDGCGECVIDDEGHAVLVGDACKLLDVQNLAARVRDGLAEQRLGVGTEGCRDFLLAGLLRYKGALDAQLLQRDAEEVVRATVDFVGSDEVVAGLTDVEDGIEVGCLTRRGQHSAHTAFEGGNLRGHRVVGGILQASVEVALLLQVEEVGHFFRVVILERGALDDGEHARFAVLGLPACLYAERGAFHFLCHC